MAYGNNNNSGGALVLGVLLAIGLFGAGWQISNTVYKARLASNVVTVKGFAEREVKADLALWRINFSVAGDNLAATYENAEKSNRLIREFLTGKGFAAEEIAVGNLNVSDMLTNQYRSGNQLAGSRYVIQGSVSVRSNKVDAVNTSVAAISELVKSGVVLSGNFVEYQFTRLKDIKPEMLREATQNARNAAEQFAQDAGSSVGSIQSATQGYFSVVSRDAATANSEGGYGGDSSDMNKTVRVVTTVTYYLDK